MMPRTEDIYRDANEIQHHCRHVQHVVRPVTPAREESVEVAEDFFRPKINPALARIAMSQLDDGDALWPEKQKKRDDPEPDGDAAIGRDGRNNVEVENSDNEEKYEIAAPEGADQVRLSIGLGSGGHS